MTESKTSLRTPLKALAVEAPDGILEGLKPTLPDLCAAAVVDEVLLGKPLEGGTRYEWPAGEGAVTVLGMDG